MNANVSDKWEGTRLLRQQLPTTLSKTPEISSAVTRPLSLQQQEITRPHEDSNLELIRAGRESWGPKEEVPVPSSWVLGYSSHFLPTPQVCLILTITLPLPFYVSSYFCLRTPPSLPGVWDLLSHKVQLEVIARESETQISLCFEDGIK